MDGMSARYSEIPHSVLQKISTRITNTVKGAVNRVVYDITHKPPALLNGNNPLAYKQRKQHIKKAIPSLYTMANKRKSILNTFYSTIFFGF